MTSVTLSCSDYSMCKHICTGHTNTIVTEFAVSGSLAVAVVFNGSQCEEQLSSDVREWLFMIYDPSVRALTVLIFTCPGVKLDKMLLSFHGWKQKRQKDSCGGKETTTAITPAGRLNTDGTSVTENHTHHPRILIQLLRARLEPATTPWASHKSPFVVWTKRKLP